MKILVIEDEKLLADSIKSMLERKGFQVECVYDGESGKEYAELGIYDLLILDVMMPKMDGFEVARQVRMRRCNTPILMLTARSDVADRIAGLNAGADYYLTKPFEPRELLARLRAMTRRVPVKKGSALCYADLVLDPDAPCLKKGANATKLTSREARLLEALIRAKGSILSREQLALQVFGYESDAEYNNVEVYLSFLRKKIAFLGSHVAIKAERGKGYRLQEDTHVP